MKTAIITLGCSKNTVESEAVAGIFVKNGFELTGDVNNADIIVIHTCSFIKDAQKESFEQIERACALKQKNKNIKIFVSGCLPQLLQKKIEIMYPLIDGYTGTDSYGKIVNLIKKNKRFADTRNAGGITEFKNRILSSALPSAYIKISEGCSHGCSYCIIPKLRGKYHSRTLKSVTEEARALADSGIKELNVIAQDTTYYGTDIYGRPSLDILLKELAKIKSLKWIRLLYAYPSTVTQSLLEIISGSDNICSYLDIPVQHVSRNILKNMKRPLNTGRIIENIKKKFPEIILRTSLITGFPGETEKDFSEMKDFIKEGFFEHVGIFGYSDQEEAKSFLLQDKISVKKTESRRRILSEIQYKNVVKNNKKRIGRTFEVLTEYKNRGSIYARAYFQAPEIDSGIIVRTGKHISGGVFKKVIITGTDGYDLTAEFTNM